MKTLLLIPFVFLLMSFTHPFAQDGSVDNDRELLDERIEKAEQNKTQEERARETVKQEQEANKEIDRNLQPEAIIQDKKEGSVE
jgi:hypothetical protein